jgi:hypothetical protein
LLKNLLLGITFFLLDFWDEIDEIDDIDLLLVSFFLIETIKQFVVRYV